MRGKIVSALVGLVAGRRSALPVNVWLPALTEVHGHDEAKRLLEAAEARYRSLVAARPVPEQRALRGHLLKNILPGLALYEVLREEHAGDQQAALGEIARVFRAWAEAEFRPSMRVLSALPGRSRCSASQPPSG